MLDANESTNDFHASNGWIAAFCFGHAEDHTSNDCRIAARTLRSSRSAVSAATRRNNSARLSPFGYDS